MADMKTILITGASGLIGTALKQKLLAKGYEVKVLSRSKSENTFLWKPEENWIDENAFENVDTIIHLAGSTISKRWTQSYKKEIYSSRIQTASLLYDYVKKMDVPLRTFISASGVNYYGTLTSSKVFVEEDKNATDFFGIVCQDWEDAAFRFQEFGSRVCVLRTGAVLSPKGGMLKKLLPMVKLNSLSVLGSGKQILPWIHLDDLIEMYVFLIENQKLNGAFNAVAPQILDNQTFTEILMKTYGKKIFLPNVPSFVLKLILGEMSSVLLEGSAISSKKIQENGFNFQFPDLEKALIDFVEIKP